MVIYTKRSVRIITFIITVIIFLILYFTGALKLLNKKENNANKVYSASIWYLNNGLYFENSKSESPIIINDVVKKISNEEKSNSKEDENNKEKNNLIESANNAEKNNQKESINNVEKTRKTICK